MKQRIKPGIPKRHLLLVATSVWLFAGGFLLYRGILMVPHESVYVWIKLPVALIAGLLMFHLLFLRISFRHIKRIRSLEILRPCIFSFFDWKSYLLMAVMITLGILIRKSGWIEPQWIAYFFIAMATPLLLSSIRFFRAWVKYRDLVRT